MPKKTFRLAHERGLKLLCSVKGNQKGLREEIAQAFAYFTPCAQGGTHQTLNQEPRGWITKTTSVLPVNTRTLAETSMKEWQDLSQTMIRVVRKWTTREGAFKEEVQYYLSNKTMKASVAAYWIAQHWLVENQAHQKLDGRFAEDRLSTSSRAEPCLARLRAQAFNADPQHLAPSSRVLYWLAQLPLCLKTITYL